MLLGIRASGLHPTLDFLGSTLVGLAHPHLAVSSTHPSANLYGSR